MLAAFLFAFAGEDAGSLARFTFHDSAQHEGRPMLAFRAVQLGPSPVRPLSFAKPPSKSAQYGLLLVGADPERAPAIVWDEKVLWFDANNDNRLTLDEAHRPD